jgi:uncharacterized protein (DUF2141 family)
MVARDYRLLLTRIIITLLLVGAGLAAQAGADSGFAVVSGNCTVSGRGELYVFLVDDRTFALPMKGLQTARIRVDTQPGEKKSFAFSFRVFQGRYGLRCYLDENGNGKLDKGLLGPAEPWGMSWQGARSWRMPVFADIAFTVDGDLRYPSLDLE